MSTTYNGNTGWFCCGPDVYSGWCDTPQSSGACGTCDNFNPGCAWPNLGGACSYSYQCVNQIQGACGLLINVDAHCYNEATIYNVPIVDCGPDQNALCGTVGNDCLAWAHPVTDLTPNSFSALAPMGVGRISVTVQTVNF